MNAFTGLDPVGRIVDSIGAILSSMGRSPGCPVAHRCSSEWDEGGDRDWQMTAGPVAPAEARTISADRCDDQLVRRCLSFASSSPFCLVVRRVHLHLGPGYQAALDWMDQWQPFGHRLDTFRSRGGPSQLQGPSRLPDLSESLVH